MDKLYKVERKMVNGSMMYYIFDMDKNSPVFHTRSYNEAHRECDLMNEMENLYY